MSNEIAKTSTSLEHKAQEYHSKIVRLKKQLTTTFLDLAEAFSEIKNENLYLLLGFKSFNDYIHSPEVEFKKSSVHGLIRIYELLLIKHKCPAERIRKIEWSKLHILAAHFSDDNPEPLLLLAENNSRNTIRMEIKKFKPKIKESRRYGQEIKLKVMAHGPTNEMGVVFLFSQLCAQLNYKVDYIQAGYPDCIAKRKLLNDQWESVRVEFEFRSKEFIRHRHKIDDCDLIICWENNWKECPIEVLSLKEKMYELNYYENSQIT